MVIEFNDASPLTKGGENLLTALLSRPMIMAEAEERRALREGKNKEDDPIKRMRDRAELYGKIFPEQPAPRQSDFVNAKGEADALGFQQATRDALFNNNWRRKALRAYVNGELDELLDPSEYRKRMGPEENPHALDGVLEGPAAALAKGAQEAASPLSQIGRWIIGGNSEVESGRKAASRGALRAMSDGADRLYVEAMAAADAGDAAQARELLNQFKMQNMAGTLQAAKERERMTNLAASAPRADRPWWEDQPAPTAAQASEPAEAQPWWDESEPKPRKRGQGKSLAGSFADAVKALLQAGYTTHAAPQLLPQGYFPHQSTR
jgi:hypothetical protein